MADEMFERLAIRGLVETAQTLEITALDSEGLTRHLEALADILRACVHDGASVNFILPFEHEQARAYWIEKVAPPLAADMRVLLIATVDGEVAGTVQLGLEVPPNQVHRAEVSKLLIHPRFQRMGIARALMQRIEARARDAGRSLLTLDTAGDIAERLYLSLGYIRAGSIPGYCRHPTEDRLEATILMYKVLAAPART